MILLLVIPAWILVLSMVAGLCVAARAGDQRQLAQPPGSSGWRRASGTTREPHEHLAITARANRRPARVSESGASLRRNDGVAA
jgi:hypothetical protein